MKYQIKIKGHIDSFRKYFNSSCAFDCTSIIILVMNCKLRKKLLNTWAWSKSWEKLFISNGIKLIDVKISILNIY